ncbi:MAG: hypothetical protein ABJF50_20830 [Paracoccaceae bacterium]
MHKLVALFLLFAISACSSAPNVPDGVIVPTKTLLPMIKSRPYECYEYDATDDTCKALAERTINGNTLTMDTEAREFVPGFGPFTLNLIATFKMGETSFCGDLSKSDIEISGGLPSNFRKDVVRSLRRDLAKDGVTCIAYLRDAQGQFYSVTLDGAGEVKGAADPVVFFAQPKEVSL